MFYVPSKFNFIHKCNNGTLRLYNSMAGLNSLVLVSNEDKESALSILTKGVEVEQFPKTEMVEKFIKYGFLVSDHKQEETLQQLRIQEQSMDNALHLILLPTEQCNFRCKYCYETFQKGKMSQSVQDAIIKYVRKNINQFTKMTVSWFGGEPLEALDVITYLSEEFIQICKTARKPYSAGMTTNGFGLTLDNYNLLTKLKVSDYQITLDGTQAEHDKQRVLEDGSGTFNTIIENLLNIKQLTRSFNSAFTLRTNFTKTITDNLENYLKYYSEKFGDDPRFTFYVHMASNWGGERVSSFSNEIMNRTQYRELLNKIKQSQYDLNVSAHCSHINYTGCVCYASKKNSIVIGSDGILYKCTGDFEFDKNKVGHLTDRGNLELNNNYYLWLSGLQEMDLKCKSCFYGACCLSMNCPAVKVRELKNDSCSFEKENLGMFLELFDENKFLSVKEK